MAHPEPSARSAEQVAEERAMAEVSDVLLNLEHTLVRARKARTRLASGVEGHNVRLALDDAVKALEVARKRLQQDVYFAGDELRLI
ncbi:MAG: hypothetical protein H0W37_00825 [Pseudonocardiales bacterium]|nr:hypothetical protein [Pseudonocardiales bacterium]